MANAVLLHEELRVCVCVPYLYAFNIGLAIPRESHMELKC